MDSELKEWLLANGHDAQWWADWTAPPEIDHDAVSEWFLNFHNKDKRLTIPQRRVK